MPHLGEGLGQEKRKRDPPGTCFWAWSVGGLGGGLDIS